MRAGKNERPFPRRPQSKSRKPGRAEQIDRRARERDDQLSSIRQSLERQRVDLRAQCRQAYPLYRNSIVLHSGKMSRFMQRCRAQNRRNSHQR